ncbi:hypothetical protein AB6A40_010134 [Gnathostoma spinigerum]|uniref:Nucleolus and neural progenitor protein-like N-terminal domain-containing protein n=1 Tax=Gnathostoma spinigerum TaxID=75299 RepID=A0ABD6EV93_9BILA
MEATDYVEACLLSRAALISRLDSLCIKAGDYCFRQLELGHLIPATLLILALVADIWKDIQSQLRALIDSYERVRQAVVSSRLPPSILQYEFLQTLRQNDRSADTLSFLRYRRLLSDALQISSDDVTTSMLSQLVRDEYVSFFQRWLSL